MNFTYLSLLFLILYCAVLYFVAHFGESKGRFSSKIKSSAITYSLSLAVFCTSWTFYGNIGQASHQGISYIALYIGATLSYVLFSPILMKMVRVKSAFHSTSIADFISTRYNNSQLLAASISILCLVGIIPYISIQIKSIIETFKELNLTVTSQESISIFIDYSVVIFMVIFTIAFGVRRLDPTEKHPGMVIALAFESLLKLVVFLFAGLIIIYGSFGGFNELFLQFLSLDIHKGMSGGFSQPPEISYWLTPMALGAIGVLVLPRQFHVGIVECDNEKVIKKAKWMFPLYLLLINIMVVPIAMASILTFPDNLSDFVLLKLLSTQDHELIAILVFLGGFAASSGMIMVSVMTLSTMATNHIFLPIVEFIPGVRFLRRYLLYVRWVVVLLLILLSYYYYQYLGESEFIVNIGSISFVAVAQLIPALLGGMLWKKGHLNGAFIGMLFGGVIWFYTLIIPAIINSGVLNPNILFNGPFDIVWLRPEQLFGLDIGSSTGHSLFWSLLINSSLYVIISEWLTRGDKHSASHVQKFFSIAQGYVVRKHFASEEQGTIDLSTKRQIIIDILSLYIPQEAACQRFSQCCYACQITENSLCKINVIQLSQLRSEATHILAGFIGMAAANKVFHNAILFDHEELEQLNASYSS